MQCGRPRRTLAAKPGGVFDDILKRIGDAIGSIWLSAAAMGMIAPWSPKAYRIPDGNSGDVARPEKIAMAVGFGGFNGESEKPVRIARFAIDYFPIANDALNWLAGQQILTPALKAKILAQAFANGVRSKILMGDALFEFMHQQLEESTSAGESAKEWKTRAEKVPGLAEYQVETIGRTFGHRGFHDGLTTILNDPVVQEEFPYLQYVATKDPRTRESHAALDGKVAHKDSPLASEFNTRIQEWNCRCSLIPLSREDAAAEGIDDDTGWKEQIGESDIDESQQQQAVADAPDIVAKIGEFKTAEAVRQRVGVIDAGIEDLKFGVDQTDSAFTAVQNRIDTLAKSIAFTESEAERGSKTAVEAMRKLQRSLERQLNDIEESAMAKWRLWKDAVNRKFEAATKALAVDPDVAAKIKPVTSNLQQSTADQVKQATNWLSRVTKNRTFGLGNTSSGIKVQFEPLDSSPFRDEPEFKNRPHYYDGKIYLPPVIDPALVAHEVAHQIELTPSVSKAAKEFLASRVGPDTKPVKLSTIIPGEGYGPQEETLGKDNWEPLFLAFGWNAKSSEILANYTGKHYNNGHTEVVTMGVELLFRDAAKFARIDPQYFNFIVGVLRGAF